MICQNCKSENCIYNATCIKCEHTLIGDEVNLLDQIGGVWDEFIKLPRLHPDEENEFRSLIHALQDKVSYRIAKKLTSNDNVFS